MLAADPGSACANRGIAATLAPSSTSIWSKAGSIAKDAAYVVAAIVLALLLIGVAVLLWLQVQTRTPWLRERWGA